MLIWDFHLKAKRKKKEKEKGGPRIACRYRPGIPLRCAPLIPRANNGGGTARDGLPQHGVLPVAPSATDLARLISHLQLPGHAPAEGTVGRCVAVVVEVEVMVVLLPMVVLAVGVGSGQAGEQGVLRVTLH